MTKLIISRTSERNNRARDYGIYLDDKKIGTIANGETKTFYLDPGTHKINGKIDWCKSPKFHFMISENESKKIEIGGFKYRNIIMSIAVGINLIFIFIKLLFEIESNTLIFIGAIGFLYPLYYITLGKNHYLTIREKALIINN